MKPRVLSIGCAVQDGPDSSTQYNYLRLTISDLKASVVSAMAPDAVLAWLFCNDYDIFDVAQVLSKAGYTGQLIAVSEPLPNKAMVCREIAQAHPTLRFDLSFTAKVSEAARQYFETIALERA